MAFPVVDVHAHFVTDRYVREARASGADTPDGMPAWPTWSADDHLALMDQVGIDRAVLSVSSPGVHFGVDEDARALARHMNDFAANVAREHSERFGFFAVLPLPDRDGAHREAARSLDELGADGVGLLSNYHGAYLSDPSLDRLWELLSARRAVVHVHPTSPPNWSALPARPRPMLEFPFETARTFVELALARVPSRYPDITFIASHCGGALPLVVERADRFLGAFGGEPADVRAQLERCWFDVAGTPMPEALPALAGTFGESRIVYGSDYCFTPAGAVAVQLTSIADGTSPSGASWPKLLSANASRLLAHHPAVRRPQPGPLVVSHQAPTERES